MQHFSEILKNEKLFREFRKSVPERSSFAELKKSFASSVENNVRGIKSAAVLFSGGVDSALIASAVSKNVKETILFTTGTKDSNDISAAEEAAKELGLPLIKRIVEKEEIPRYAEKTSEVIGSNDNFQLQIAVPEFICMEKIKSSGFRIVFSGQGSDELFCGYSVYRKALKEGGYGAVREMVWARLEMLYSHDLARDNAIAGHFCLELKLPFLDEQFARIALAYPAEEKILSPDDTIRKHPLRKLAAEFSVPEPICSRKKKAIQYGSGIGKEVQRLQGNSG